MNSEARVEEECLKVAQPQSHLQTCVCSCQWFEVAQPQPPSWTGSVCAYVNAWRWYLHLEMCVLMSMLGGGTAIISILNGVCAYVNAYTHLETCAHVNAWRWHSHNLHVFLNHECVCLCQCLEVVQPQSLPWNVCVRLPMSMLSGGGPSWDKKGAQLS